ncbi:MAG: 7-cyano-7-deazaguanine synthase [Deltaproteobacteria bacterium]|nr:7-cyano-7-deazaguanine synthase [Deltaproteobacteria bacterium]
MIPKTIIHLLSGGLDSVTMLYDLTNQGHNVHALLFDYKQRHAQELQFAITHAKRAGVLWTRMELPQLGGLNEQSWIVPNRNAIFLSVAVNVACQAGADTVTIGCNEADAEYFPDCRKAFLDAMNAAVKSAGYDVEICAPYLDKSKTWIARLASDFRIRPNEIWTCYQPTKTGPCGKCPACKKLESAIA